MIFKLSKVYYIRNNDFFKFIYVVFVKFFVEIYKWLTMDEECFLYGQCFHKCQTDKDAHQSIYIQFL